MNISDFQATPSDIAAFQSRKNKQPGTEAKSKKSVKLTMPRFDLPEPQGGRFVKGPIPLNWLQVASRCGRRGVELGLLLWYAAGWQRTNPVKLTKVIRMEFNIGDKTTKRILVQMQDEGIVDVEFHRGRSPLVTLRSVNAPGATDSL